MLVDSGWVKKRERETEGEEVEFRLGYSFCHCCMMFNMPDRGCLAEVLYPGENAAELRSLDGKSCLHPIFHYTHSPLFFYLHSYIGLAALRYLPHDHTFIWYHSLPLSAF